MSSGNLLLLRELIAGGLAVGTLAQVHGIWRWRGHPGSVPGLVDLVEARLAGVSPEERSVLEVIAAGEPIGAGMLAELASVEMLAALERAGVVETRRAGRRISVSMSHPLYGEIVRSATSPLRARTIAATLARALEGTGARRRGDVLRLGTWFLQAGIHDRPDILLAAADEAAVAFDFSLAEALIRAAGPAGGLPGQLRLAEALIAQGRGQEADDVHASSEALATMDEQRVHLAIARSMNLFWGLGRGPAAYDVLAQAQGTVSDPGLRNELAATRAVFLLHAGETDEAVRESLAILRGSHRSEVAGTAAAVTAAWGLIVTGRFADSSAQLGRAESAPTDPQPVVARWLRGRQWIKFFLHGSSSFRATSPGDCVTRGGLPGGDGAGSGAHAQYLRVGPGRLFSEPRETWSRPRPDSARRAPSSAKWICTANARPVSVSSPTQPR